MSDSADRERIEISKPRDFVTRFLTLDGDRGEMNTGIDDTADASGWVCDTSKNANVPMTRPSLVLIGIDQQAFRLKPAARCCMAAMTAAHREAGPAGAYIRSDGNAVQRLRITCQGLVLPKDAAIPIIDM